MTTDPLEETAAVAMDLTAALEAAVSGPDVDPDFDQIVKGYFPEAVEAGGYRQGGARRWLIDHGLVVWVKRHLDAVDVWVQ